MASDLYLQIDGIEVESADSKHQGWIAVKSVNWAVTQPWSATASTGCGHAAERCGLTQISFHKMTDLACPILLHMCAGGKTISKGKCEFMRADGAEAIEYVEMALENVLIAHVASSAGTGTVAIGCCCRPGGPGPDVDGTSHPGTAGSGYPLDDRREPGQGTPPRANNGVGAVSAKATGLPV